MKYSFEKLKEAMLFNTQEVIPTNQDELDEEIKTLITEAENVNEQIRHYIGFEISGKVHLGTGMMTAIKIKKLQDAGVKCSIFFANYHSWLNQKLDGKMETIIKVKDTYFKPMMVESCRLAGCNVDQIDFVDGEKLYSSRRGNHQFWDYMMKVAKNLTLGRVNKSVTITGKQAGDGVEFGLLCYPVMQVADAFFMQTHIVHAGLDQRKCHVLMREVASKMDEGFELKIGEKKVKPIAVHHNLLLSLGVSMEDTQARMSADTTESLKMSKSKPDSAIWVHDSPEEIARKVKKAFCPIPDIKLSREQNLLIQQYNPILDWSKKLLFPAGINLSISRSLEHGGNVVYEDYESLEQDYLDNKLHPLDLKNGFAQSLSNWLSPIYKWSIEHVEAMEILKIIQK